jgi:hypothetical protein
VTDDRNDAWRDSGTAIRALEQQTGISLLDNPPYLVDQWGAEIRELFNQLDSELLTAAHARCAFNGAYVVAGLLTQTGPVNVGAIRQVCTLLRWLHERGEEEDGAWTTLTAML